MRCINKRLCIHITVALLFWTEIGKHGDLVRKGFLRDVYKYFCSVLSLWDTTAKPETNGNGFLS